jgi:hypothetical protein
MHLAVSGALIIEKETTHNNKAENQQLSVYFVSGVLTISKKFYSEMEKIGTQLSWARGSSGIILKHTQLKS